jgi:hypothetical protein
MLIKYDIEIDNQAILNNIDRITNQIFKLLPSREEGGEWLIPLQNLILEVGGMTSLLNQTLLFSLLSKLETLTTLDKKEDFLSFRKMIFECLSLLTQLKEEIQNGGIG